jgi:hypothetical protein
MNPADPSTPPEELQFLARAKKVSIQRAVAENPNAPETLLNTLWEKHPACMLANPILDFWEITEPGSLLRHVTPPALLALYNHLGKSGMDLPTHIFTSDSLKKTLERAFSHSDDRIFLHAPFDPNAKNRLIFLQAAHRQSYFDLFLEQAPDRAWSALANDPDPEVRLHFAQLLSITPSSTNSPRPAFTEAVRKLANLEDLDIHQHLARSPIIPPDVIERIARVADSVAKTSLSGCLFATQESLQLLCQDEDEGIRRAFAKNSTLNAAHQILVKDTSPQVRSLLAQNRQVKLPILSQFDIKDHPSVLKNLFKNPRANENLRSRIFTEGHPDVRDVLTDHGTPLKSRFFIAHKSLIPLHVRRQMHSRTGLPAEIVAELATDPDRQVRLSIAKRLTGQYGWRTTKANLDLLGGFINDPDSEIRLSVCTDSRLTSSQIASLTQDVVVEVKEMVTSNILQRLKAYRNSRQPHYYRNLYEKTAHLLLARAKDPESRVRQAIARSKEAPPEALGILFDDPVPAISSAVRSTTQFPFGAILDLEKTALSSELKGPFRQGDSSPTSIAIHHFAHCKNPFLRHIAAHYSRTTLSDLRALGNDPHPVVREAAIAKLAMRESKRTSPLQYTTQPA